MKIGKRGQALVEFILILPIFMFILLGTFDVGRIFYQKYQLESDLDYIAELYQQEQHQQLLNYIKEKEIEASTTKQEGYIAITVSKKVSVITPILSQVFHHSFSIETKRVIYDEKS